jgi:predicted metal-dependent hydrolase
VSTTSGYLSVRGIDIDVVYKDIKNLHIGVYPPLGRVRVAAPLRMDDEQVRLAVVQRLSWIKRHREQIRSADRQSERQMVTGETHYVWGVPHRLKVVQRPGPAHVEVDGDRLLLYVPEGTPAEQRRLHLDSWYRSQLRRAIPPLIATWEPILDATVPKWSIRRMKTKWGSCNRESGHLWFNVELAKKHPDCLKYIVVHEMTHLLERNHTEQFAGLMTRFLPHWQALREQLNQAPLVHEEWAHA